MPILIDLFATIGAIRYAFPAVTPTVTVPITILSHLCFATTNRSSVSLTVYSILALIANTVYSIFYWLFVNWSQNRLCQYLRRHLVVGAGCLALFFGFLVVGFVASTPSYPRAVASISASLFCALILLVPSARSRPTIRFATWLVPLLVPMVMGDWLAIDCHSSWTLSLIMAPICLRLLLTEDPPLERPIVQFVRMVVLVHGVWDNLSSRHNRNRRSMPVYASLFLYSACLDITMFGLWKLKGSTHRVS
jgi:hypothetical protein